MNLDELTSQERALVAAVTAGEVLDLAIEIPDEDITLEVMSQWGAEHHIRAGVIRAILRGFYHPENGSDPKGLQLRGAVIPDRLDLQYVTTAINLTLNRCYLPEGITAVQGRFTNINLTGSHLAHSGHEPALDAEQIHLTGNLIARRFTTTCAASGGAVHLHGARIDGQLSLEDSWFSNERGPALSAAGLQISGDLNASKLVATGVGPLGTVSLPKAQIGGDLVLVQAQLSYENGPAFFADGLRTSGSLFARELAATGAGENGAIGLLDAKIAGQLNLTKAQLTNEKGPALNADRLHTSAGLFARELAATGTGGHGAVRLSGAKFEDQIDLTKAQLTNENGPAIFADGLHTSGGLFARELVATGTGELGAVRLLAAQIDGQLDLTKAQVINENGPAVNADRLHTSGDLVALELVATGAGKGGAVRLPGAQVDGQLVLNQAQLTNKNGPALNADSLHVLDGLLARKMVATGANEAGAVRLPSAQINGQLDLNSAQLINEDGPALSADNLHVTGGLFARDLVVTGASEAGAVRLLSAHVDGQLVFNQAQFTNENGPALDADSLHVTNAMFALGLVATGAGPSGAVRLPGAQIDAQLVLVQARLTNENGPALIADRLHVGGGLFAHKLVATGAGEGGAVRLLSAQIDGHLGLVQAQLTNDNGPALFSERLHAGGGLLADGLVATGTGRFDGVRLDGAELGGLRLDKETLAAPGSWDLEGARLGGYPNGVDMGDWLTFLRKQIYTAAPYRDLAEAAQAAGHERDVRRILIQQREHQLDGPSTGRPEKLWGKVTKFTLGFGYKPWLALIWLAGLTAIAGLAAACFPEAFTLVGDAAKEAHTSGVRPAGCSVTERILTAVDAAVPLVETGVADTCGISSGVAGTIARWAIVVTQLLGWAFATLFVAGFTKAVRNP